jgi:hypothetical protein
MVVAPSSARPEVTPDTKYLPRAPEGVIARAGNPTTRLDIHGVARLFGLIANSTQHVAARRNQTSPPGM